MNQQIINYLQQNKEQSLQEVPVEQLRNIGYGATSGGIIFYMRRVNSS